MLLLSSFWNQRRQPIVAIIILLNLFIVANSQEIYTIFLSFLNIFLGVLFHLKYFIWSFEKWMTEKCMTDVYDLKVRHELYNFTYLKSCLTIVWLGCFHTSEDLGRNNDRHKMFKIYV